MTPLCEAPRLVLLLGFKVPGPLRVVIWVAILHGLQIGFQP